MTGAAGGVCIALRWASDRLVSRGDGSDASERCRRAARAQEMMSGRVGRGDADGTRRRETPLAWAPPTIRITETAPSFDPIRVRIP